MLIKFPHLFYFLLTLFSAGFVLAEESQSSGSIDDRPTKLEEVRMTAYTHTESDHVKYGRKNAIGTRLRLDDDYSSVAADWSIFPLGTKFKMEGKDTIFVVDDYGSALVGKDTLDIYTPSKRAMNQWGVRYKDIEIVEFGDYDKSREILAQRKKWRHCRKMLAAIDSMPDPLPVSGVPMSMPEPTLMLANVESEPQPEPVVDAPKETPAPAPEPVSAPEMAPIPDADAFLASLDAVPVVSEPAPASAQSEPTLMLANVEPEPQPEPVVDAPKETPVPVPEPVSAPEMAPIPDADAFLASLNAAPVVSGSASAPAPVSAQPKPAPVMELASYTAPALPKSATPAVREITFRKVRQISREEAREQQVTYRQRSFTPLASL